MDSKRIRLAIVEDNLDFRDLIKNFLINSGDFDVVAEAGNGEEGLRVILENELDVALIDVVLPVKDGLYILEQLRDKPQNKPVCIMLSGISQDSVTSRSLVLGADYFILKPFDLDLLGRRIKEVYNAKIMKKKTGVWVNDLSDKAAKIEEFVTVCLRKIPIPTNLKGYLFIKTAIMLAIHDPNILGGITKMLYPTVAKMLQSTPSRVERAIRHAIETAWDKGYGVNYYKMLGYRETDLPKPTNSAFVSSITELYLAQDRE